MKWYPVPDAPDLSKPFLKKVKIGDKSICLVGYEGKLYAVSAICPHQGFDMSNGGHCENGKLICPMHGYSFDLQTGKGSQDYIKTFPVKIEGDTVYIATPSMLDDLKKLFR